jgi:hypothetical protein
MVLAPALVTVEAPNTAKLCAAPSDGPCAIAGDDTKARAESPRPAEIIRVLKFIVSSLLAEEKAGQLECAGDSRRVDGIETLAVLGADDQDRH